MAKKKTVSKVSPKGGKKGCICEDGTYSSKCCDGTLQAQGIGLTTVSDSATVTEVESNGVRTRVRVSS